MVMDEAGRNGGNWHLAQQFTYHVTLYIFQQLTQLVIIQKQQITQLTYHAIINHTTRNIRMGGKIFFYL